MEKKALKSKKKVIIDMPPYKPFQGSMGQTGSRKVVLVGMSGGVDSSVTAAILKGQGYDVRGVFLLFWSESDKKNKESLKDAKEVARILRMPLSVIDARKKFQKEVVNYFLEEYKKGKTPNPCVFCNENMKFKILFEEMEKMKSDFVATGHYARLRRKIKNQKSKIKKKFIYKLLQARDKEKDQSYFLYRLNQKRLSKLIFPLGEYEKSEVKQTARKFKLPVFGRRESQNVCFLLDDDTGRFLKDNLKHLKTGNIKDSRGIILGKHQGLPLYTVGQRKGINVGGAGPYYVVSKDRRKNVLRVTNDPMDKNLYSQKIKLEKVVWIAEKPSFPARVLVKARYQQESVYAIISRYKRSYLISFENPQKAMAPGQSAVFYGAKEEVLGGGIIKS